MVHTERDGETAAQGAFAIASNALATLNAGFTTVQELGDESDIDLRDAIAAGRVAQAIARAHAAKLPVTVSELHDLQAKWSIEQAESFQAYMRRERDPEFVASGGWPER